jgi:hypothetical protein
MEERRLTDMKQVAYLMMKDAKFNDLIRDGNKKIFVFPDGELVDKLLIEYYNSDVSRFIQCYENVKTLVYRS